MKTLAKDLFQLEPDRWLADVLCHDVYRLSLPSSFAEPFSIPALCEALSSTLNGRDGFCYSKIPTRFTALIKALTEAGFYVVDTNVTFSRPALASDFPPVKSKSAVFVREAVDADMEQTLQIAESCFVYSRFHLDPLFPKGMANKIKRLWIQNYFEKKRGDKLLVAEADRKITGFLALLTATHEGERRRVIDLVGVKTNQQGKGIGRALLSAFVDLSRGGFSELRVGTQVSNIPSMRLYEKCGFHMCETAYVMHAHFKGGRAL